MATAASAANGRRRSQVHVGVVVKRTFDIVLGSILCLLALPLVIGLAIGVGLSLRYWPFFAQQRPGRNGRTITIAKLRTLPSSTPRYVDKHTLHLDTISLPWLCRVLRRTHLDELPQLASVVKGDMSLVGPRPPLPSSVEPLDGDYERIRRSVRPGCTGLWQLSVASTDTATSAPRFDLFYIDNASLRLDIWILLRTVGWMLGLAAPIEVTDVPRWLLGAGLLHSGEPDLATYPAAPERSPAGDAIGAQSLPSAVDQVIVPRWTAADPVLDNLFDSSSVAAAD